MPIPSKPYTMPLGLGSQINSAHGHASHFLLTSLLSLNNYEMNGNSKEMNFNNLQKSSERI